MWICDVSIYETPESARWKYLIQFTDVATWRQPIHPFEFLGPSWPRSYQHRSFSFRQVSKKEKKEKKNLIKLKLSRDGRDWLLLSYNSLFSKVFSLSEYNCFVGLWKLSYMNSCYKDCIFTKEKRFCAAISPKEAKSRSISSVLLYDMIRLSPIYNFPLNIICYWLVEWGFLSK